METSELDIIYCAIVSIIQYTIENCMVYASLLEVWPEVLDVHCIHCIMSAFMSYTWLLLVRNVVFINYYTVAHVHCIICFTNRISVDYGGVVTAWLRNTIMLFCPIVTHAHIIYWACRHAVTP